MLKKVDKMCDDLEDLIDKFSEEAEKSIDEKDKNQDLKIQIHHQAVKAYSELTTLYGLLCKLEIINIKNED